MYRALSPTAMTAAAACHRCRTPLAVGDHAWQATAAEQETRGWLCLPCGRPFATGRPGRSAELEAMRRMRAEPIVGAARPAVRPRVPPATPRYQTPAVSPRPVPAPSGARRWGRRLAISLIVVFASSPLSAAGPTGRMLAVLVGGPAAVLFWVSVVGLPIAALRDSRRARRQPTSPWIARPPDVFPAPAARQRATTGGGRVRVSGGEDSWVKGVRGEHAVGAALNDTGLPVLHDRRLQVGSDANIDHLIVAADAVYVVDAKNLAGALTATGDQLRVEGRDRAKLLDGVRRQVDEVAAALSRLGVQAPVRGVLCFTGAARPAGVQFASGVLLTTPDTVAQVATLPGLLTDDQRARIADLLAWAFPPAVNT